MPATSADGRRGVTPAAGVAHPRHMDTTRFLASVRATLGPMSSRQAASLVRLALGLSGAWTDPRWVAYGLATAKHETAHTFEPITERGPRDYFDRYEPHTRIGQRLGNTFEGDGFKYRGRGFVQITGRANYATFAPVVGLDLVGDPSLALGWDAALTIMTVGMERGLFTGRGLKHYIGGTRCDRVGARRVINGNDKAELIAGYALHFETAMNAATAAEAQA